MFAKNDYRKPQYRIVHRGKHSGSKFMDVPAAYLIWFMQTKGRWKDRRRWCIEELQRRGYTIVTDNSKHHRILSMSPPKELAL